MKERVVDRRYDPVTWLGRKIFRRDQLDESSATPPGTQGEISMDWHASGPAGQAAAVGADGKLPVAELVLDRPAAASPFGDDLTFPLPPETLTYQHPEEEH